MNEYLAQVYGTNDFEKVADDGTAVMDETEDLTDAALEYLVEEGVIDPEEFELVGGEEEEFEKEAGVADYHGRVMAHAFWDELGDIEKDAASLRGAWEGLKAAPGHVKRHYQRGARGFSEAGKTYKARKGLEGATRMEALRAAGRSTEGSRRAMGTVAATGVAGVGAAGYGGVKGVKKLRARKDK